MSSYRIAVIAGDGIGQEVVPEGIRVLDAVSSRFGLRFQWEAFPWGCDYFARHGRMMPEDGLDLIRGHDAIYLGASASLPSPITCRCGACSFPSGGSSSSTRTSGRSA